MPTQEATHRQVDQSLVDRAQEIVPMVREAADRIESDRRLPRELVDTLRDAGFFRLYLPRELGGLEANPFTLLAVVGAFASVDASTAWCVNVANQAAWLVSNLPAGPAREFIGPDSILLTSASPSGPLGTATPVDGGYRVNGRWSFASGSPHATIFHALCVVPGASEPPALPVTRYVFLPPDDCHVLDTWQTMGLRGTGSHDFEVRDVFVPAKYSFETASAKPQYPGPLYRFPFIRFAGRGTLALGVARRALDAFIELAATKQGMGTTAPLRQQEHVQVSLAGAEASWRSARAWLIDSLGDVWDVLSAGDTPSRDAVMSFVLAVGHAVNTSLEVTQQIFTLGGSTSNKTAWALDRCLRDLHAAATDVTVGRVPLAAAGRELLGEGSPAPWFQVHA
ncbi:MAG: acyl-CoA dehydrogenase family protein [Dehalococcoidia bacterium]